MTDITTSIHRLLRYCAAYKCQPPSSLPPGSVAERAGRGIALGDPILRSSLNEVADLARQGFEFGGHSVSHSDLTALTSEEALREMRDSRSEIEERTGRTVTSSPIPTDAGAPRSVPSCNTNIGAHVRPAQGWCSRGRPLRLASCRRALPAAPSIVTHDVHITISGLCGDSPIDPAHSPSAGGTYATV